MTLDALPSALERFNAEMIGLGRPWRLAEAEPGWVLIVDPDQAGPEADGELLQLGDAGDEAEAVARARAWLRQTGRL